MINLSAAELRLLDRLQLPADWDGLSDERLIEMEDIVADYLQLNGLGDNDSLNAEGRAAEALMNSFARFEES